MEALLPHYTVRFPWVSIPQGSLKSKCVRIGSPYAFTAELSEQPWQAGSPLVGKLFVLDEGVEIPSVPASASSKSRGHYPLVNGAEAIEGITVVSGVSRGKSPFGVR